VKKSTAQNPSPLVGEGLGRGGAGDWPTVDLEEIADISAGNPAPQDAKHFSPDGYPFIRMQDVGREHIEPALVETTDRVSSLAVRECGLRLYPAGTLLIPKSGASVNLNHRAMLGGDAYVVSHFATIIPDQKKVLPAYLFHWSQRYDPRSQAQVTSLPSLPLSLIRTAKVPLPPLEEQHRIVELLDKAATIKHRVQAAQAKARTLIPALFLDMFGDPATNPKGWPIVRLKDVIDRIAGGKNIEAGNGSSPYRILKVSAVTSGYFRPEESKPAPDNYEPLPEHHIRKRDFLFSRAKTSALVGAVALIENDVSGLLLPDKIWRIEWKRETIEPRFAYSLLRSDAVRRTFAQIASGTSDSMKNISQSKLNDVEIPLPPLILQTTFAQKAEAIRSITTQQSATLQKAQATFDALLANIFTELIHD
jgi:type I restriction enzyme S subunit